MIAPPHGAALPRSTALHMSPTLTVARLAVGAARTLVRALPTRLVKHLEDRFFYAVFQTTRVTNDAYGWRPTTPPGPPPPEPE